MENIRRAARSGGRNPEEIRLLAASKQQDVTKIRAAMDAGIGLFGENYVQEAALKIGAVGPSVEWHMIGHLQRNKVRQAVRLFSLIQTLDSFELAVLLDREGGKQGKVVRVFLEVNLAREESKGGVPEENLEPLLKKAGALSHLRIEGLMVVPPIGASAEEVRPYFRRLKELRGSLNALRLPNVDLKELSMGMTHDYPVAIEEGATIVRLGTALFGARRR